MFPVITSLQGNWTSIARETRGYCDLGTFFWERKMLAFWQCPKESIFSQENVPWQQSNLYSTKVTKTWVCLKKKLKSGSLRSDWWLDKAPVGHLSIFTCETSVFFSQLTCRILNSYEETVVNIGRVNNPLKHLCFRQVQWLSAISRKCTYRQKYPPGVYWSAEEGFGVKELHLHCLLILSGYATHLAWQKKKFAHREACCRIAKDVQRL